MAISLEAFRKICNGTENVGEIRLNASATGLEKVNNHVYKTSKNNVRLTAEDNRQVRSALVSALARKITDPEVIKKLNDQLLGNGNDVYSLSRDYVRHLIAAATSESRDRLEKLELLPDINKDLRNRKINDINKLTPSNERLVKSRKAAAYVQTINEMSDESVSIAREAITSLSKQSKTSPVPFKYLIDPDWTLMNAEGWIKQATKASVTIIAEAMTLLKSDTRLKNTSREYLKKDMGELRKAVKQNSIVFKNIAAEKDRNAILCDNLKDLIRNSGKEAGVDKEIIDEHLRTIFGNH